MNQLKIKKVDSRTGDEKMLKNSVDNFPDYFYKIKDTRDLVRVCIKNDNQPRNVQYRKKQEPRLLPGVYDKVTGKIKGNEKPIKDKNVPNENQIP